MSKNYKVDINTFIPLEFEFQIGILLEFLREEYMIGILADNYSYSIYYIPYEEDIKRLLKYYKLHGTLYISEVCMDTTKERLVFKEAILDIFKRLEQPF